jgi:hypothetical protein
MVTSKREELYIFKVGEKLPMRDDLESLKVNLTVDPFNLSPEACHPSSLSHSSHFQNPAF